MLLSVIHLGLSIQQISHPIVSTFMSQSLFAKRSVYWLTISEWRSSSSLYYQVLWRSYECDLAFGRCLALSLLLFHKRKSWSCITCCPIRSSFFQAEWSMTYHFSWSSPLYVQINQFITGQLALGKNAFNIYILWIGLEQEEVQFMDRRKHRVCPQIIIMSIRLMFRCYLHMVSYQLLY